MDNQWATHSRRKVDLGLECPTLKLAWRVVVVVVETTLTHSHRSHCDEFFERGDVAQRVERGCVVRMDPGSEEHPAWMCASDFPGEPRRLDGFSNADDRVGTASTGAFDDFLAIRVERS